MELLLEGISIARIESSARAFGMAKGPFAMIDEIGLDTVLHGGRLLWEAWPERIKIPPLLIPMYKKRLYGTKTRAGFFLYEDSDETAPSGSCTRTGPSPSRKPSSSRNSTSSS